jgi:lysophospholipase II
MEARQPFPEPHTVLPTSVHTHTAIFLHGRGSNGAEFADELFEGESISEESLPQHFPGFKWVFPNAHSSFSTVFQEELVEWFDIYSLSDPSALEELQIDGLRESVIFMHGLIEREIQIFGPTAGDRIILGGISQGCAVAITALLTGMCGIGAFVGFNGWMPLMDSMIDFVSEGALDKRELGRRECQRLAHALRKRLDFSEKDIRRSIQALNDPSPEPEDEHLHTPVFLSHTADDNFIEIALGRDMRDTMFALGLNKVVWKEYGIGGHWIPAPEGFEDIVDFLNDH